MQCVQVILLKDICEKYTKILSYCNKRRQLQVVYLLFRIAGREWTYIYTVCQKYINLSDSMQSIDIVFPNGRYKYVQFI